MLVQHPCRWGRSSEPKRGRKRGRQPLASAVLRHVLCVHSSWPEHGLWSHTAWGQTPAPPLQAMGGQPNFHKCQCPPVSGILLVPTPRWKDSRELGAQHSAQSPACRKCSRCAGRHDSFTPTGIHGQPEKLGLGFASVSGNTGLWCPHFLSSACEEDLASSGLDVQHQGQWDKTRSVWVVWFSTKDRGQWGYGGGCGWVRGSAPRTEGLLAVKGGAAEYVDSGQLDSGQLCRSRARDSSCGVGLGQESYPKRSHSGDGGVSHLMCKLEVQTETQTSAVSQELSAEALGEWKERKLSSEQHRVCVSSQFRACCVDGSC